MENLHLAIDLRDVDIPTRLGDQRRPYFAPYIAARLFAAAFAANPKLTDDLDAQHRYNAACAAALAASGQGKDAAGLDDNGRKRWRKQALDWLRADLAAYAKQVESGQPEARTLVRQRPGSHSGR